MIALSSDKSALRIDINSAEQWEIRFLSPIVDYASTQDRLHTLVLTEPDVDSPSQSNLFCISNLDGKIIWQRVADKSNSKDNIYTGIKIERENSIIAWDWDGNRETINIETGDVISRKFVK